MISSPSFLTFTGADDATSIEQMLELAEQYPVEWGILFSPKRQGQGRYPSLRFVRQVLEHSDKLRLSAHLCGDYSRELLSGCESVLQTLELAGFRRVQINTLSEVLPTQEIGQWAQSLSLEAILQCRSGFPEDTNVSWLYDNSGGHGLSPDAWPASTTQSAAMRGYAGGLRPANISAAIEAIASPNSGYWLDMESGVRDERDRFDIELCRQVCGRVWGSPQERPAIRPDDKATRQAE